MNTYRESINKPGGKAILNRDKNKLANYSFDKEETKISYLYIFRKKYIYLINIII